MNKNERGKVERSEGLAVEPVGGGVRGAVLASSSAAVGVAASSQDAVDVFEAVAAAAGVAQVEPGNGAGAIGAGVGGGRGVGAVELLAEEGAGAEGEGRDAGGVEVVVADEGDVGHAAELEGGVRGEGVLGVGAGAVGEEVQGDGVVVESLCAEAGPGGGVEGLAAVAGVQVGDVVEHGECAGSSGFRAGGGTGVVLDAEAEGDALQGDSGGRRREFLCWIGC